MRLFRQFPAARVLAIALVWLGAQAPATPASKARLMWDRIVGSFAPGDAVKVNQMATLIAQGRPADAAAIATTEKRFIDYTVRGLVSPWSNETRSTNHHLNGISATAMGVVRDGLNPNASAALGDFRTVFYGDFQYVVAASVSPPALNLQNDDHHRFVDVAGLSAYDVLVRQSPQWPGVNLGNQDPSGVMTVTAAKFYYDKATNRRPVAALFKNALCKEMDQVLDASAGYAWVGRDIDRSQVHVFEQRCAGCHGAALDAMRGAFVYLNTNPNFPYDLRFGTTVDAKYHKNQFVFPDGYVTTDNSWENRADQNHNREIGWRGPKQGQGTSALAKMFVDSEEFSRCMGYQIFEQVCQKPVTPEVKKLIRDLARTAFEEVNYRLHRLYQAIAAMKECTGE